MRGRALALIPDDSRLYVSNTGSNKDLQEGTYDKRQ